MKDDHKFQLKVNDMKKRFFDEARSYEDDSESFSFHITFFNKLHCSDALIDEYEKFLLRINEFEIATQLSLLKKLI